MSERLDVLVFYVPVEDAERVLAAVFAAGGGRIGAYDSCAYRQTGTGQFRPLDVADERCELVLPRRLRAEVVAALVAAHPYETPAFHVLETADIDNY